LVVGVGVVAAALENATTAD